MENKKRKTPEQIVSKLFMHFYIFHQSFEYQNPQLPLMTELNDAKNGITIKKRIRHLVVFGNYLISNLFSYIT